MPPTPAPDGTLRSADQPVRSADVVNEEIRALVVAAGCWLYGDTRQRYEQLRDEWTVAVAAERRVEVVEAA